MKKSIPLSFSLPLPISPSLSQRHLQAILLKGKKKECRFPPPYAKRKRPPAASPAATVGGPRPFAPVESKRTLRFFLFYSSSRCFYCVLLCVVLCFNRRRVGSHFDACPQSRRPSSRISSACFLFSLVQNTLNESSSVIRDQNLSGGKGGSRKCAPSNEIKGRNRKSESRASVCEEAKKGNETNQKGGAN